MGTRGNATQRGSRAGSPDKAAPAERRFACPAHGGPRARPRHTCGRARSRPLGSRSLGVRAAASSRRCALASGPRGPLLSRPGRRAARNKGAATAPAAPRRVPSPRAPGPLAPLSLPPPQRGRALPRTRGPSTARPGPEPGPRVRGRPAPEPHSPLQHQDDGEPLGNLAESGAMQTLELRCGHSMATRTAAGTAEALGRRDFRGSVWGRF